MGLKQTVDYDQGFVTTKLGCLGIKVWVFTFAFKGRAKQGQV
jgi:ribosomal protein S3